MKIAVELMYGTGRGYLDTLLENCGVKVTRFHDENNPLFGGIHPEPNAHGMEGVSKFVRSGKAQMGLGLDGDADRFGIVDKDGTWLTPNQILTLALYHLKKNRGWTGAVVRTVPTSHQVDAVANLLGVKVYETPVGFKYIGALMESEPIIVGGEESGGLSVKGHVPEKDGILACLLMAELVATEKKSLGQILKELAKQIGEFYSDRINISFAPEKKEALLAKLGGGLANIGAFKVEKFITTDGYKFLLPNNEWVAFRASGTEPLIRCYLEAKSKANLQKLDKACRQLLAE
jgi:phosphoglucomutase